MQTHKHFRNTIKGLPIILNCLFFSTCSLGSGLRYQILSHVFAHCASQKTFCHARFSSENRVNRDSRMAVDFLTRSMCKKV